MRKTIIWVVALVFALGLSIGLYFNRSQDIQTGAAVLHDFTTFIEGAGNVDAPTQVIVAPSGGLVKQVFVREGQHLQAGDAVMQMDDTELRLQLEEATLALNAQKKEYQRQNGDLSDGEKQTAMVAAQTAGYGLEQFNSAALSPQEHTVGIEQVDLARLKVEQAADMLGNATVHAALEGTVLEVDVREGELLSAGYQSVVIASMDDVEIDSVFSDMDASTIAPGMAVQLHGGCLGSGACSGVVTEIVPKAETQQSDTGMKSAAIIKIKPSDYSLFGRLGASVELKVITGRKTAIGVPIEALAQDATGLYVYVVRQGRAYRTPVEVGVLDEYYAEVKTGVQQGDVVALNPTELRNRMKVSV